MNRGNAMCGVCVAALAVAGCAVDTPPRDTTAVDTSPKKSPVADIPTVDSDLGETSEPLWFNTTQAWTVHAVDVCWEAATIPPADEREWVRQAISRTWSFAANLEFTGWAQCPTTSTGIRIRVQDDTIGPRATAFGRNTAGLSPGLILDHTFQNFQVSPSTPGYSFVITCTPSSTAAQRKECIENIAVHEFGHLLAFHHEQNAPNASSEPDFPASCAALVRTDSADALYNNDWDLVSVMNYCSPAYGGPRLSALDFAGAAYFYGASPRYTAALTASVI